MIDKDTIYNGALEMLKQGHSKEEVLLEFPNEAEELSPLLETALLMLSMPKNIAPQPAMQRKYALKVSESLWFGWLHVSRFAAASVSLVLLLTAFATTGYAAYSSAPGQTFFSLKKVGEKIELTLAISQNQKANIQLAIAQQRLSDAQTIFNNPQSGNDQKTAALTELTDQTNSAVALINTVAKSDPTSNQNHPLINSLENIAQGQKTLLAQIKPDKQIQSVTSSALASLNQNAEQLSQIQQTVAVASSDQALAKIENSDPNSIAVLGNITQASSSQITVENSNTFLITAQTLIQDSNGNPTTTGLTLNTKVNVIGIKGKNTLTAQQISIINPAPAISASPATITGIVQGTSTVSGQGASVTIQTILTKKPSDESSTSSSEVQNDGSTTIGSFITEDPSPQFVK